MKIFIGWSHDLSHEIALSLHKWLPNIIQSLEPYVSSEDISKGSHWFSEICDNLDEADYGIICLTPENITEPWILFEAGALGTKFGKSKVCPLLWKMSATDLKSPLSHFQACSINKKDMLRLVGDINEHLEPKVADERLVQTFELWWPKLEAELSKIKDIKSVNDTSSKKQRTDRDMLEEILQITRNLSSASSPKIDPDNLINVLNNLKKSQEENKSDEELLQKTVDDFERAFISERLKESNYNLGATAKELGIHLKTLEYKIRRLKISLP